MSKAPETIYIDRDGAIGRWYTQLEKDVDVAYVRGDIAYGYASELEQWKCAAKSMQGELQALRDQNIKDGELIGKHCERLSALESTLRHLSRNASVMTAHQIETMARDALTKEG